MDYYWTAKNFKNIFFCTNENQNRILVISGEKFRKNEEEKYK